MTRHTQLSAQMHLVEAAEQLREARETLGEGNKELVGELDSISPDIEISSDRSGATDERTVGRWQQRKLIEN